MRKKVRIASWYLAIIRKKTKFFIFYSVAETAFHTVQCQAVKKQTKEKNTVVAFLLITTLVKSELTLFLLKI